MLISRSTFFSVTLLLCLSLANAYIYIPLNRTDDNGCGIGQEFRGGSCKLCRPGAYRFLGPPDLPTRDPFKCRTEAESYESKIEPSSSSCVKCPAGTFNPYSGAQTYRRCLPCPSGTTSGVGARKCWKCGPGKSSAAGSPRCVKCRRGYYMSSGCSDEKPVTRPCTKCPKGTYSTGPNQESCTPCPEGTSTKGRGAFSKRMCKTCGTNGVGCSCRRAGEPWGQVSSFRPIGASVCTSCPAGTRARSPFATKPEDCIPCPNGTSHVFLEGCKKCRNGYKSFGIGASDCRKKWTDECPSDSFKDNKGVCKLCPAGYAWNTIKKQCDRCPPGTTAQGFTETTCRRCIFPKVAPPNDGFCTCRKGYFRDSSDNFDCKPCPKGTKKEKEYHEDGKCDPDCENFPDQPACETCKPGYEKDYSTEACNKCDEGLVSIGGNDRCGVPQTGCRKNQSLFVSASKFGYYTTCYSSELSP